MAHRYVAVILDGVLEVHASGAASDYATLCGLDGNDREQKITPTPIGARINCAACCRIIKHAKQYRTKDFA